MPETATPQHPLIGRTITNITDGTLMGVPTSVLHLDNGTQYTFVLGETPDAEDEGEDPDTYLDRVDGHWYVVRYDRTAPQIHAPDCATCAAENRS